MSKPWNEWIKENLDRGCNPVEIRDILLKNNFSLGYIKKEMGALFPGADAGGNIPAIDYEALAAITITRSAKRVPTELAQLYIVDNFMTAEECDQLVELSREALKPSTITTQETEPDKYFRTSSTCYISQSDSPLVKMLDRRIAETIGISASYSEEIQIQRYEIGQEFKAHTDYFEPGTKEYERFCATQGNRTWTFMVYLNDVEQGGGTQFTILDQTYYPQKGMALVWNNLDSDGLPNPNTKHWGLPVEKGFKVVITKWFRERGKGQMLSA